MIARLIAIAMLLATASCVRSRSSGTTDFMSTSSAAIHGGVIATPEGAMRSFGQSTPPVHPFYGRQ